jgi:hypothetical protein
MAMLPKTASTVGPSVSAIAAHTSSTVREAASELASIRNASFWARAAFSSATSSAHDRWLSAP